MTRIARGLIAFGPAFKGRPSLSGLRARIPEGAGLKQAAATDAAPLETGYGNKMPPSLLGGRHCVVHAGVASRGSPRSSEARHPGTPRRQT